MRNLVGAFALAVTDRVSAAMAQQGALSGSAAAALLLVYHGHARRIDDLRPPLMLTQAGVVRLVDRLVAAGYAERIPGIASDRRTVALTLTEAGTAQARKLLQARERAIAELLDGLAPDQVEHLGFASVCVLAAIASAAPARARICRYCDEQACDLSRCPVELGGIDEGGVNRDCGG